MKIEKISDDQVKFTLNQNDLTERNIKLTELSYGSEKTQELFREMMIQAMIECDFHTENNTPLIIEAIPVSPDSIMIIVTKASRSEDMDSKFNFIPKSKEERKFRQMPFVEDTAEEETPPPTGNVNIFSFKTFDGVVKAATRISGNVYTPSALFKNSGKYYLVLHNDGNGNSDEMKGLDTVLGEYGQKLGASPVSKMFLVEHGEVIIEENAVEILADHLG